MNQPSTHTMLRAATVVAVMAFVAGGVAPARAALPPDKIAQLPSPSPAPVDFARDIQPIFEASCVQCHGRGKSKGGFSLETREDFIEGGDSGAAAMTGRSAESTVVEMISGLNPEVVMPKKGKKLTRDQIAVVRAWIDQGMRWPAEITFFKPEPANLRPRELAALPDKPGFENPIDRLVDTYLGKNQIAWGQPVDDRTYARRVWLDTIGLLPPPAGLEAFVAETGPGKRERLVRRLLADQQSYAEHWLTFWYDMLRNDYKGTGYTDGGRKQITGWVYTALARNTPYDQFVAQLINPGAEAEGFTKGILWRGAVNASMVPPMQAAQGVAQVFLGVNLKCASCHDSFINDYTLNDSYGLASIYADGPLEIAECDRPTGHMARVKFLYDELGSIDGRAAPAARRQQLVEVITGRQNGRLPRTIVNRLWQRFLGYGLVEPVDEMDKPAWSPELLDWLAEDLVVHGYDLKHTMMRILTSRAYQLPAVNLGETAEHYAFRGPAVRRLSAEQFADAITTVAGLSHTKLDGKLNRFAALNAVAHPLPLQPKWIWGTADAHRKAPPATFVFRRVVALGAAPTEAHVTICADDNYSVKINGKAAGSSARRNSTLTDWLDVKSTLKAGDNTIEITAMNMPPDDGRLASFATDARPEADSAAGLILYARVRTPDALVMDFVSDGSWTVLADGKEQGTAIELGGVNLAPWKLGQHFLDLAAAPKDTLPVQRAALVFADPLMAALGRPNREQVVTVRQSTATTLQALELTNGATLARLLKEGTEKILASQPASTAALVESLYRKMISRPPNGPERTAAEQLVGSPIQREGIEDLLWILAMLPEFQLIH
ncbi:MAG: DUF1553 domain-containing protein [Verrucomicrobia bacterium]|nr:DUF1553 domain-containing protein [Verrucomicrobiota bacterium]